MTPSRNPINMTVCAVFYIEGVTITLILVFKMNKYKSAVAFTKHPGHEKKQCSCKLHWHKGGNRNIAELYMTIGKKLLITKTRVQSFPLSISLSFFLLKESQEQRWYLGLLRLCHGHSEKYLTQNRQ